MALTTKRLNWLKWLYPGEVGLQNEQNWQIDKRRNHMSNEHTAGVLTGLDVQASGTPDLFVHVQPGRAIDKSGEEIVVDSVVDLDVSPYSSTTVYIVAEYAEQGTDPYIVPETSASQNKFTQDAPSVTIQGSVPTGDQIELARIVLSAAPTQIYNPNNPMSPSTNQIDHRYRDVSAPVGNGVASADVWIEPGELPVQLALAGYLARVAEGRSRFRLFGGAYTVADEIILGTGCEGMELIGSGTGQETVLTGIYSGRIVNMAAVGTALRNLRIVPYSGTPTQPVIDVIGNDKVVENVIFDAPSASSGIAKGTALSITGDRVRVVGCTFLADASRHFDKGIYVTGSTVVKIENCHIEAQSGIDIRTKSVTGTEVGVSISNVSYSCRASSLVAQYCNALYVQALGSASQTVTVSNFEALIHANASSQAIYLDNAGGLVKLSNVDIYGEPGAQGEALYFNDSTMQVQMSNVRITAMSVNIVAARDFQANNLSIDASTYNGAHAWILGIGAVEFANISDFSLQYGGSGKDGIVALGTSSDNVTLSNGVIVLPNATSSGPYHIQAASGAYNWRIINCYDALRSDGIMFVDTTGASYWESNRQVDYTTGFAPTTIYQADCDLVVHATAFRSSGTGFYGLSGLADPTSTPTTVRQQTQHEVTSTASPTYYCFTMHVPKGWYWEVVNNGVFNGYDIQVMKYGGNNAASLWQLNR